MTKIPVIDVFAGPGGLCEGFSRSNTSDVKFDIKLSIEKDPVAHRTLLLRAFYRKFESNNVPDEYYEYLRGEITKEALFSKFPKEATDAERETWCAELGKTSQIEVHKRINNALGKSKNWLLIGGPPCQAYSMVGRSRMLGKIRDNLSDDVMQRIKNRVEARYSGLSEEKFENAISEEATRHAEYVFHKDHRHQLYKEYLEVVAAHQPSVFVMENVKGILSSKIKTRYVLDYILEDLRDPWQALDDKRKIEISKPVKTHNYKIYSFVVEMPEPLGLGWPDFIINSEEYGVPQRRHRLILLGIRDDVKKRPNTLSKVSQPVTVEEVLGNLPKLRSHISRKSDRTLEWGEAVRSGVKNMLLPLINDKKTRAAIRSAVDNLADNHDVGGAFISGEYSLKGRLGSWLNDSRVGGVLHHRARGHMVSDLMRYLFASAKAQTTGFSPTLYDFPIELLPNHKNTAGLLEGAGRKEKGVIFEDRFRVQVAGKPATTITSHISKDGHYYIHYDPSQCRSLTGREAARLQTFSDNYFFEGNRTEQYHQIGNAVPPYLAFQLAGVVADVMKPTRVTTKKNGGCS